MFSAAKEHKRFLDSHRKAPLARNDVFWAVYSNSRSVLARLLGRYTRLPGRYIQRGPRGHVCPEIALILSLKSRAATSGNAQVLCSVNAPEIIMDGEKLPDAHGAALP